MHDLIFIPLITCAVLTLGYSLGRLHACWLRRQRHPIHRGETFTPPLKIQRPLL